MMGYVPQPESEPIKGVVATSGPNAPTVMLPAASDHPHKPAGRRRSAVEILREMQPTVPMNTAEENTAPVGQSAYRRLAARRSGRPVEPWRSALRSVLIAWGLLLLAAFATPVTMSPLTFNWDAIIHRTGLAEVPLILIAALGLLGVVVGAIPMPPFARGMFAALLGLGGIVTPIVLAGALPPWMQVASVAGLVVAVASLLVRNEYTESILARIVVTLAIIAMLLPLLMPQDSGIPLVALVKSVIHGKVTTAQITLIISVVLAALCLLVWLPGPATGGAAMFAWLFLLLPLVSHVLAVVLEGDVSHITTAPHATAAAWVPASGYLAFAGYGLATVFGKALE